MELAERYDAMVYTDDAHAVGILGRSGRGSAEHFGLHGRVAVQAGTLSKALASVGGYIAGTTELRDFLFRKARPFAISTGHIAPPSCAAVIGALDVIESAEGASLLEKLWTNATYLREGLQSLGFDTGDSETPIIPIILRDPIKTIAFSDELYRSGILVRAFVPPTVPNNTSRLRAIVSATHSKKELDIALEAFERVDRRFRQQ